MPDPTASDNGRLLTLSGVAAAIGAALWGYKGIAILLTGDQPDYAFEVALAFFGASVAALVYALKDDLRQPATLLVIVAWITALAGAVAAVAYLFQGDDGLFGPAALATFVALLILLFLIGSDIRRNDLLARWSFVPSYLAWSLLLTIPIGALLSGIDERLLEVPLLFVATGWAMLAAATLSRPKTPTPT